MASRRGSKHSGRTHGGPGHKRGIGFTMHRGGRFTKRSTKKGSGRY